MTARARFLIATGSLVVLAAVVLIAWQARTAISTDTARAGDPAVAMQYLCPMHPQIVSDHPGSCPICGMDLVLALRTQPPETEASSAAPEGLAQVRLSADDARRIAARTVVAERIPFAREVRAAGNVTADETRLTQVHTKTGGWVEKLWANAVGETVRRGEPLLEIYSPELLAAQEEYLVALRARDRLAESPTAAVSDSGDVLLASARSRLRLLDLADRDIDALTSGAIVRRSVHVASPASGTILERAIAQGARVEPDTMLLKIADLSRVWILAAVYEFELPFVREGQQATATLPYLPGKIYAGRVTRVYPTVDLATRTTQVRLEFENPGGELRPGMYAEVHLSADLGPRLSVPSEAVMETGTRSIVFVEESAGTFTPREISSGLRLPHRVEVLSGLDEGERVLAHGNFFVDAESKLAASLHAATKGVAAHDHR